MSPFRRALIHGINATYRWLPLVMGCHRRPERSFCWPGGRAFPVCARCTGELAGFLLAAATGWLVHPPVWMLAALMLPMIADGLAQALTRYESTNARRFLTGLLFGYALPVLLALGAGALFRFGVTLGQRMNGR